MNMVRLADALRVPIVYISTSSVFSGSTAPKNEYDIPNPVNHYGLSKLYGEYAVKHQGQHYIIRCGWMFGGGQEIDHKFVGNIYRRLKNGPLPVRVVQDGRGSLTYTKDVAAVIKQLLDTDSPYGTYHCVLPGQPQRKAVAVHLALNSKYERERIETATAEEFVTEGIATRPKNEYLANNKLKGIYEFKDWKESIREYAKLLDQEDSNNGRT